MPRTALLLLVLTAACVRAPLADYTTPIATSAPEIESLVTRESVPGAAVAVVVGDSIVWQDTFGYADVEAKTTVRSDTRFRVGSVTKLITATGLMRLVEEGRVHLDDPVTKYLPTFAHGNITLRQLAGHLGGIRHYGRGEFINTTHFNTATESLSRFAADPLVAAPGEKYSYSSYGYNVLGAVIEAVTGKPFPDAVASLVLRPAGMRESGFIPDRATTAFYELGEAKRITPATEVDLSDRVPSGALLSTARDLARFLIATTDSRFLSDQSRSVMFTPQSTSDGKPTRVGIGWRVASDEKSRMFVHHGGEAMGGRAFVLLYPRERVGVVFVANVSGAPFNEKNAAPIATRFIEARP